MTAYEYTRQLCETFGPRGSATPSEREAHRLCEELLHGLGLETHTEAFLSHASPYRPFLLATGGLLLAQAVFVWGGAWGLWLALGLAAILAVSAFLDLAFVYAQPLRWCLPRYPSQNVYGILAPQSEPQRRLVLVCHVDSHRTPWIWANSTSYAAYRIMSTLGMVCFGVLLGVYLLAAFGIDAWSWLSWAATAVIAALFLMLAQAESSAYTTGANDNASGCGAVLALAQRMAQAPPEHTEVWFLFTGCEEVGAHGSRDFVRRHGARFREQGMALIIDGVGARGSCPRYFESETLLRPLPFPDPLIDLARRCGEEHSEDGWPVRPFSMKGAFTDAAPFLMAGIPAMAIVNHDPKGWIPRWHHPLDTMEQIDPRVMERSEAYLWSLCQAMIERGEGV